MRGSNVLCFHSIAFSNVQIYSGGRSLGSPASPSMAADTTAYFGSDFKRSSKYDVICLFTSTCSFSNRAAKRSRAASDRLTHPATVPSAPRPPVLPSRLVLGALASRAVRSLARRLRAASTSSAECCLEEPLPSGRATDEGRGRPEASATMYVRAGRAPPWTLTVPRLLDPPLWTLPLVFLLSPSDERTGLGSPSSRRLSRSRAPCTSLPSPLVAEDPALPDMFCFALPWVGGTESSASRL